MVTDARGREGAAAPTKDARRRRVQAALRCTCPLKTGQADWLGSGNVGSDFLDISSLVNTTLEGGLLGLAFHPDYASNGYFYVNYTRSGTGGNALTTVIARYSVSAGNPNLADPA
ncbi:MAG: PQQ-dependent sugar dehydrogenase [Lysobacterales bacterium]